jgi:hypothetical protein
MSGKNQQASAKAGEIPSQNLSNYLWRVVHPASFPCIVRSGTSPECAMFGSPVMNSLGTVHWKINWSGFESAEVAGSVVRIDLGQVALGVNLERPSWEILLTPLWAWRCLVRTNKCQQKLVRSIIAELYLTI